MNFRLAYLYTTVFLTVVLLASPFFMYLSLVIGVRYPYAYFFLAGLFFIMPWRLLLLISGKLNFATAELAFTWAILSVISLIQIVSFWGTYFLGPEEYTKTLALTLFYPWIFLLGGEAVALVYGKVRLSFCSVYGILLFTILLGTYEGFNKTGSLFFYFMNYEIGLKFNYHNVGDSFGIVALLLTDNFRRTSNYWNIFNILCLSVTFSRSSFFAYLIAATIHIRLWSKLKEKYSWIFRKMCAFMVLCTACYIFTVVIIKYNLFGVTLQRFKSIFNMKDPSLQERLDLFRKFPDLVVNYGLLGRFMYELLEEGYGTYIHNILSYWLEYGIFLFLTLLSLIFVVLKRQVNVFLNYSYKAGLSVLLFVIVSVVLARSYVWPYLWFGISFASVFPYRKPRSKKSEDSLLTALE